MGSVLAIVSKAQFTKASKQSGRLEPGRIWPVDRYDSSHRSLTPLSEGGALYLVTVAPGERLWLVAVLSEPELRDGSWFASANTTPIRDITDTVPHLRFATGNGIQAKPGALGMSLQTPRGLTQQDEALLQGSGQDDWIARVTLSSWCAATDAERNALAAKLIAHLGSGFASGGTLGPLALPVAIHHALDTPFVLVPGGCFRMGLGESAAQRLRDAAQGNEDEEDILMVLEEERSWHPEHEVDVAPFLIAAHPMSDAALAVLLDRDDAISHEDCIAPSFVPFALEALSRHGMRLPSEAEWEYACRGALDALFPGGVNETPDEPGWPAGAFGERFGELPELCADGYHHNHEGARGDALPRSGEGHVVRGGASLSYPWQGPNWIVALCASRGSLAWEEFFLAFRPAVSLAPDEVVYGAEAKRARAAGGLVSAQTAIQELLTADPVPKPAKSKPPKRKLLEGYADRDDVIIQTMYDKEVARLFDFAEVGLDEARALEIVAEIRKKRIESGYYAGDTVTTIPSWLKVISDPRIPARHELVPLLLDIITGNHAPKMPLLDWRRIGIESVDRCMFALAPQEKMLVSLLEDRDLRVRAGASMLVATAMQGAVGSTHLSHAYVRRDDVVLRANLAVAMGVAAHPCGFARVGGALSPDGMAKTGDPLLRSAIAIGNSVVAKEHTRDEVVEALVSALDVVVPHAVFFPWNHGDVFDLAAKALMWLGPRGVEALTAGLRERVRPGEKSWKRSAAAEWLLELHFRFRRTLSADDVAQLTPLQRAIMTDLSPEIDAPKARFDDRGFSLEAKERRKLLGL